MACKGVPYGEVLSGARKVHPFFHSEQPKAYLPLMMCPFPHSGQGSPSLGTEGVEGGTAVFGEAGFCRAVFGALAGFPFTVSFPPFGAGLSSFVSATRRLVLSARTECTISATICLSSSRKVLAS